jgi:hypothetical protein
MPKVMSFAPSLGLLGEVAHGREAALEQPRSLVRGPGRRARRDLPGRFGS